MPSLTPRATVVRALAIREAELLDQTPASGHVLVALIWEAGGVAARALADVGLAKGADQELRGRLENAPDSERGMSAHELLRRAANIATEHGHDYIGTEHQLLAIIADESLGEALLAGDVRERAGAAVHEDLPKRSPKDPKP